MESLENDFRKRVLRWAKYGVPNVNVFILMVDILTEIVVAPSSGSSAGGLRPSSPSITTKDSKSWLRA